MKTPDYVQVTGLITQNLINIQANDSGGELDPHGADQRGNPLGGLVFSKAFGNSANFVQAVEWHKYVFLPIPFSNNPSLTRLSPASWVVVSSA